MSRAFLYKETVSRVNASEEPVTYYIISKESRSRHNGDSGWCRIESTDEEHIMNEVLKQKANGVIILSRVPSGVSILEEIISKSPDEFKKMVVREPYVLSQTFARYKGNKKETEK